MNDKILELLLAILEREPPSKERTEILKFYLLPRNTAVKPMIEIPDEALNQQLGPVQRASSKELEKRRHPEKYEGEEAMKQTLGKMINNEQDSSGS